MKKLIQHIRQSLSLKLSIGALLLAGFIFATSLGVLYYHSRHLVKQETIDRASIELKKVSLEVSSLLSTIQTAAESNSWLVTEHLNPDSLLALSRRIVSLNANLNGCSITTEPNIFPQYGRYFSAYSIREGNRILTAREAPYEYFEKTWYKTPHDLQEACWVDPFDDYNEGTLSAKELIASYCKPLYDADKKLIGVISTDISLKKLRRLVKSVCPYPESYIMITGHSGHIIAHPDSSKILKETIISGVDASKQTDIFALSHEMNAGATGSQRVVLDGKPCIVCYQPIAGTIWSIALVCPEKSFLHSYNNLTFIIIPLIVIGLLLIALFCHHIVHQALKPLNVLVEQSKSIIEGVYDEQIPHTKRIDAVGQLQNSFASMQESLNRHINDIQQVINDTAQRNEELLNARKMAEDAGRQKITFIQNVTHQIRTPLNIIMGFAQVLHSHSDEMAPEELHPITDTMLHNTASLSRMILMLYDSSDIGHSQEKASFIFENVPCNQLIRECIEHTCNFFPNIHIKFETTLPDSFTIQTSHLYLMRSLRELLYNSAKFSDRKHISVNAFAPTYDTVYFIFEDTGPGIAEEFRDTIFIPFNKPDDLSEGLGLGLPLVKNHIELLGGKLTYDIDYHEGCRFIVEFERKEIEN